jgi:hypothetical protein
MRTFAPGTGGEMKAQSMQSRFIQMLEVELSFANNQLVEAREDIEFYRAKVERLEQAIMSNPRAQQEYVQSEVLLRPAIKDVKVAPQTPPRIPFSDLKRQWAAMSAEEQEKAMQDGWEVDKQQPKEEANAG